METLGSFRQRNTFFVDVDSGLIAIGLVRQHTKLVGNKHNLLAE
jgi:hypothetical protein